VESSVQLNQIQKIQVDLAKIKVIFAKQQIEVQQSLKMANLSKGNPSKKLFWIFVIIDQTLREIRSVFA